MLKTQTESWNPVIKMKFSLHVLCVSVGMIGTVLSTTQSQAWSLLVYGVCSRTSSPELLWEFTSWAFHHFIFIKLLLYIHRNSKVAGLKVEFKKKKLCLKYITIVQYLLFFQVMIKIQFIKTTNIIIQNQRIFLTFLFKPLLCSTLLKFHLIIF